MMTQEGCILVLGLGNPILGDDGVGWRTADKFRSQWEAMNNSSFPSWVSPNNPLPPVEVDCLAVGGLSLMERMIGYSKVIIIDAALTRQHPLGTVSCFPIEHLPPVSQGHLASSHDTTLQNALAVGRSLGADLPLEIWVVTIEALNVYEFSEQLSPAIALAIPQAVEIVISCLHSFTASESRQPILATPENAALHPNKEFL